MIYGKITKPENFTGYMKKSSPQFTSEINNSNPILAGVGQAQGGNRHAVTYVEQELTEEERAQARANISKYDWRDIVVSGNNYSIADYSPFAPLKLNTSYNQYAFDIDAALACTGVASTTSSPLQTIAHMANMLFGMALNSSMYIPICLKQIVKEYENLKTQNITGEILCLCHKDTNDDIKFGYCISTASSPYTHGITLYESKDGYTGTFRFNSETEEYDASTFTNYSLGDTTFTVQGKSADSKAVGDALATKQDKDFIVNFTYSMNSGEITSVDKTFTEIVTAINEGRNVIACMSYRYYTIAQYQPNSLILFSSTGEFLSGVIESRSIYMTSNGAIGTVLAGTANRAEFSSLSSLVGDTPVASQISEAITNSVADWSQNDASADNYVKNRTHWEEDGVVHKLDSKYLDVSWNDLEDRPFYELQGKTIFDKTITLDENGCYYFSEILPLVSGNFYEFIIDGVTYKATAYFESPNFYFDSYPEIDGYTFWIHDNYVDYSKGGSHSLKIVDMNFVTIKQLDEKYIPDTITTAVRNLPTVEENATTALLTANTAKTTADSINWSSLKDNPFIDLGATTRTISSSIETGTPLVLEGYINEADLFYAATSVNDLSDWPKLLNGKFIVNFGTDYAYIYPSGSEMKIIEVDGKKWVLIYGRDFGTFTGDKIIATYNISTKTLYVSRLSTAKVISVSYNMNIGTTDPTYWMYGGKEVAEGIYYHDLMKAPSVATVGQTIVVKSVDDSGKPTEWECVDMASGGVTEERIETAVANYLTKNPVNGITEAQIKALDGMFRKCAFTGDVSAEYEAFKKAFETTDIPDIPDTPEVTLTSISATYSGGDVPEGTALTDLTGITVTATYSNGTTATVNGYTLSGEILEGSNIITVSYGGKTATFIVNGIVAEVTSLRGVQLPVVPTNFLTNENWQYSANSGNLATAIGSARYLYLGRVFTGTVYLRNVCHSPFAGNTASMHLVAEDYITNQTAVAEKLTATEEIKQFNGTYLTVSQDGSKYEFTNDYSNGTLYGWVRLQRFDIPKGKYAVISAANGGDSVNNTKNVDGWFTAFFEDPTEHITITEVYE